MEQQVLREIGYNQKEINQIISKEEKIQNSSCIWTHNFAIWKTYCEITHIQEEIYDKNFILKKHLTFLEHNSTKSTIKTKK
jgi:hypothetical protein